MQNPQVYQNIDIKVDKYRRNINRLMVIGGISALVALYATEPEFFSNNLAQTVGLYAGIVALVSILGAFWCWASLEDLRSGSTLAGEIQEIAASFNTVIDYVKKEFEDEFATNQGLDDKEVESVSAKEKASIK